MVKSIRFITLLLFISCCWTGTSHAYTVVLKNGKILKGKLVSETTDAIVFTDDAGVQYSLKKTGLDQAKMKEANDAEAAASAAASAAPPQAPAPQKPVEAPKVEKKARVYTKEDLDKLKEKYGEMTTGTPIENPEDYSSPGILKPEAYLRMVKDSAAKLAQLAQNLDLLGAGVSTQWEVASSTGKDASQAIQAYFKGESASSIINAFPTQIAAADELRGRLGTPPRGYEPLSKNYETAVASLHSYYDLIRGYASIQNSSVFKSRWNDMKTQVNYQIMSLQGWQPPEPSTPAPQSAPSGEQSPSTN